MTTTIAVGTSLLVITLQSTAGLLGHLHHARVDGPLTLAITALAIAGSLLGARLTDRIPVDGQRHQRGQRAHLRVPALVHRPAQIGIPAQHHT